MPFWRNYYHLIWATRNRTAWLRPEVERYVYPYLVSKAEDLGVRVYAANGWHDHLHLVVSIPPKHSVAHVVKRLKGASSHELNHTNLLDDQFNWQRGYGVLTLGERQLDRAIAYVRNQKTHHQQQSTNSWLERDDEFDEGPPDTGFEPDDALLQLREPPLSYEVEGVEHFPF